MKGPFVKCSNSFEKLVNSFRSWGGYIIYGTSWVQEEEREYP